MRTVNGIFALITTAAMLGGCSAHARVGGKVGRTAAAPQQKAQKVAAEPAPAPQPAAATSN
jgi:hypothetical protein